MGCFLANDEHERAMLKSPRYPLQALSTLREAEVERRQAELREAVAAVRQASEALGAAQRVLEAHRSVMREAVEGDALTHSRPRIASALARGEAYRRRLREREEQLEAEVAAGQAALLCIEEREAHARDALARARADQRVVDEHRARWQAERRRRAEAQHEEEAGEVAASRDAHGTSRGGPMESSLSVAHAERAPEASTPVDSDVPVR